MWRPLYLLFCGALAGCATAAAPGEERAGNVPDAGSDPLDADPGQPDARAIVPNQPDAAPTAPPVDASVPVDPPVPVDAGCTDTVVQLLGNAAFDLGPGVSWVEQSAYPLVNDAAGLPVNLVPQSGAYAVWMGGAPSNSDTLYQDVSIPPGSTGLSFSGYRLIATEELGGIYDTLTVEIRSTGNAILETVSVFSNADAVASWTPFTFPINGTFAGQTIRLRLSGLTDSTLNTNFFFDSFALRVTACQ